MKLRNILFVAAMCLCLAAMSQVPNEMAYQVLVLDPDNGKVLANETAEIRIELRKNSPTGEVAWSETYSATTDKRGMCNLTLSLDDNLDWSNNSYYFATIINGKECGAPKMTSVPYALCAMSAQTATIATSAHQASTLKGLPTRQQLIGTWCYVNYDEDANEKYIENYTFNDNGILELKVDVISYSHPELSDTVTNTYSFQYRYNSQIIVWEEGEEPEIWNIHFISDSQLVIFEKYNFDGKIYTKQ